MVRKPLLLILAAISIVVCAGIINATIWDLGAGWFTEEFQNDQHLQRTLHTNAFGYEMSGNLMWDANLPRTDISISIDTSDHMSRVSKQADRTETIASESKMTTLLLLANGIIGLVGFWRRVTK